MSDNTTMDVDLSSSDEDYDSNSENGPAVSTHDAVVYQDTTIELSGDSANKEKRLEAPAASFSPRAYQLEMLEESLRRNIIVAMDTGTGKTHISTLPIPEALSRQILLFERPGLSSSIWKAGCFMKTSNQAILRQAVLRITEELNNTSPDKLVWFLAPTVDLCIQQFNVLRYEIPMVQVKLLQGNDGVEKWKNKKLWDFVLKDIRIVVSTPQVLLDALTHGFVELATFCLLVFDEAHNCVGKSPGAKIMDVFYVRRKARGLTVPHILGLSASPVMKKKDQSPQKIEEALDSLCRTPKRHRRELMLHANMPEFAQLLYMETVPGDELKGYTPALRSLYKIYAGYDISSDPFVVHLRAGQTEKSRRALEEVLMSHKTWCLKQIKGFYITGCVIFCELGAWASDLYITQVLSKLSRLTSPGSSLLERWSYDEKCHLVSLLSQVDLSCVIKESPDSAAMISDKALQLINALPQDGTLAGIVFVKQRATVAVLAHLLASHRATKSHFRVGTVVGGSVNSKRSANIHDLVEFNKNEQTLNKFRSGQLDLVIATTVLEEGIDIPACNIILCFDKPANLKSFVQRRGRARMKKSKLVLMQSSNSTQLNQWHELELEMKRMYADDMRTLRDIAAVEELEQPDKREFRVKKTGAILNLDNAVSHLYHFCSLLPASQHVDTQPEFIFSEGGGAKVILPLSVDAAVRVTSSRRTWKSQRNAKKDAAFEVYVALYNAGLVNDNLMPLLKHKSAEEDLGVEVLKRPSVVEANLQMDPWVNVAQAWGRQSGPALLRRAVVTIFDAAGGVISAMELIMPIDIPSIPDIRAHWDAKAELSICIKTMEPQIPYDENQIQQARDDTRAALSAVFGWRFQIERSDFVAPFKSAFVPDNIQIGCGATQQDRQVSVPLFRNCLITEENGNGQPYILEEWLDHKPSASAVKHPYRDYEQAPEDVAHLVVSKLPRRSDFLHKVMGDVQHLSGKSYSYVFQQARCTIQEIPLGIAKFALLMPSILHRLEVYLVADILSESVLEEIKFDDLSLVVTAISASSALEETNYQRLEFLGDSLLKICTSLQLMAEYPLWHEGYLTAKRDQVISNARLANAALQVGLDKFIITKSFTGRKWRPLYVGDLQDQARLDLKREMSTKVLADVVEALFGAAMIDGGIRKALACMRVFLPEVEWRPLEERRAQLYELAPKSFKLPPPFWPLEKLIGYSFNKKVLLIEAMTHASCSSGTASLERLEFLGDAVLDRLIVNSICNQRDEVSHVKMHHLRSAFVNADFLAFMCMEWTTEQETRNIIEDEDTHSFQMLKGSASLPLWKFMRHSSQVITGLQLQTSERHLILRDVINGALATGSHYPWALLSRLQAPKFYSDIVESLLGAVYIDSGSLEACKVVIERMGILKYLRRVIDDGVHDLHPKEELGILADCEKVKYVVGQEEKVVEGTEIKSYTCDVFVGEKKIISMGDGVDKEEIKTKAAEAAVKILKDRSGSDTPLTVPEETVESLVGSLMDTT